MRMTPSVNAQGLYEVSLPWEVGKDVVYECDAIRTFADILERGEDIMELVYTPVGLSEADYKKDVAVGAFIITLMNLTDPDSDPIHIPDTYIISYPNMDISEYNRLIVSADLGALPINISVTGILAEIKQSVLDLIGVNVVPKISRGEASGTISITEHNRLNQARIANKKVNTTYAVKNGLLEAENAELREQVKQLVEYIASTKK